VAVLQGSEGVEQVLQILKDELKLAMMLSGRYMIHFIGCAILLTFLGDFVCAGCARLSDIKPEMVVHEPCHILIKSKL